MAVPAAIGVGAGGHAKVVVEILRLTSQAEVIGLLDCDRGLWGTRVLGIPVLGDDSRLAELLGQGVRLAFIGVGSGADTRPRRRLYEKLLAAGFQVLSAIHPAAVVSASAGLGPGATVMAGAIINAAAQLGANVIVNSGAIVEHDCVVGSHCHVATGAALAGRVCVGAGSHVGIGACVRQGIHIGRDVVVGAGAVVVRDVADGLVVAGVPARVLRSPLPPGEG
jgi:UDP-perosamine 4-acetyltransferase